MQVQLPAATTDNTWEVGANVKESVLFSGAGYLYDRDLFSQRLSSRKMEDSHLKAHLYLSVEAEFFIGRERGQRDQQRGWKSSLHADEHSPFW